MLSVLLWMAGSVDPGDFRDLRRFGRSADEPFRVCSAGGVEYAGTFVADCLGQAVVHVSGGMRAPPAAAMFIVIPTQEDLAVKSSFLDEPNRPGKSGRHFNVLNWASLNRLSLETCVANVTG
ncbi:hypothetical protein MGAST_07675 [Mycobacterium gastri 'Wayne']|uniref:Uncharacterized protein n=1 Tax=Mycobacterium gastri TaxID=1777 RepID=A0A1X1VZ96_MYCGS|nr:hypothetical protein MGAST_07675 [Mycobacterium gastri 'Wayne']ORV75557.1 hypothetical protein AWC07_23000 [Mycobacterium gastri]